MSGSALFEQVVHVLEIFCVSALIGCHGNGLRIFLYGRVHHFFHAAVVTEMDYFATRALDDATHDIDCGIVSVKQRCCCDNANFIFGFVWGDGFHKGWYLKEPVEPILRQKYPNKTLLP